MNVTDRLPALATSVLVPAAVPRVQLPTVAMPEAFDVWWFPVKVPPPVVTANVTVTPLIGLPVASLTITEGGSST